MGDMDKTPKVGEEAPKKREWKDLTIEEKLDFLMTEVGTLHRRLNVLGNDHIALKNGALAFVDKVSREVAAGVKEPPKPIIIPVRGKFRGTRLH